MKVSRIHRQGAKKLSWSVCLRLLKFLYFFALAHVSSFPLFSLYLTGCLLRKSLPLKTDFSPFLSQNIDLLAENFDLQIRLLNN